MVRYSVHGVMVVRYLVYNWIVPVFVDGGEVAVSVRVPQVKVAGRVLLLT